MRRPIISAHEFGCIDFALRAVLGRWGKWHTERKHAIRHIRQRTRDGFPRAITYATDEEYITACIAALRAAGWGAGG